MPKIPAVVDDASDTPTLHCLRSAPNEAGPFCYLCRPRPDNAPQMSVSIFARDLRSPLIPRRIHAGGQANVRRHLLEQILDNSGSRRLRPERVEPNGEGDVWDCEVAIERLQFGFAEF
jgi:hypothetical protein